MDINWGQIKNWQTFEELVSSILSFENGVRTYIHHGRDYAIDCISKDGSEVYQIKFHDANRPNNFISDACSELKKIKEYKDDKGTGHKLWKSVTSWFLVSNCTMSPQTESKWNSKVIPKFKEIGIQANYISVENLNDLLINYPDIYHFYFKGKPRSFLSIIEAKNYLMDNSFHASEYKCEFVARTEDLEAVKKFIKSDKSLMYISAPGGVGKTRLLYQIGEIFENNIEGHAFWANTSTLERDQTPVADLISAKQNLILIDEPQSSEFISSLIEQLGVRDSRMSKWKVILTVRSQNDPVLIKIRDSRSNTIFTPIELEKLGIESIEEIIKSSTQRLNMRLSKERLKILEKYLADISDGYPIWIFITLKLIEETGSMVALPETHVGVAREYVRQLIDKAPATYGDKLILKKMIGWEAILRNINIEDQETLNFINRVCRGLDNNQFLDFLHYQHEKRFLRDFGRLYRIKPDILRDYIIRDTLSEETNEGVRPSGFSKELVDLLLEEQVPHMRDIVRSISYAEFVYEREGRSLSILDLFVERLYKFAKMNDLDSQRHAFELAKNIVLARPSDFTRICNYIRVNVSDTKEGVDKYFGTYTIDHKSLVLELASNLAEVAKFAIEDETKEFIVDELIALLEYESTLSKDEWQIRHNDGKRAGKSLEKLASAGPGFLSEYDNILYKKALEKLALLKDQPFDERHVFVVKGVLAPVLSVTREYVLIEGDSLYINRYDLDQGSNAYDKRKDLLSKIWDLVEQRTDSRKRLVLLSIIKNSQKSIHNAGIGKIRKDLENEMLENLKLIHNFIEKKWVTMEELRVAREIWDWHRDYDKREDFQKEASECEEIFMSKPRARLYDYLFGWNYENRELKVPKELDSFIEWMLEDASGKNFLEFLKEGLAFAGEDDFFNNISNWANKLKNKLGSPALSNFILSNLESNAPEVRKFAFQLFGIVNLFLREEKKYSEVIKKLEKIKSELPKSFSEAVNYTYYYVSLVKLGIVDASEFEYVIGNFDLCIVEGNSKKLVGILSRMFYINWEMFKLKIKTIFEGLNSEDYGLAVEILIDTMHKMIFMKDPLKDHVSSSQTEWIFDILLEVPKLDLINSDVDYGLGKLCEKTEWYPNVTYVYKFMVKRIYMHNSLEGQGKKNFEFWPGSSFDIFKHVVKIDSNYTQEDRDIIQKIMEYNSFDFPIGYYIPQVLVQIDPEGIVVPDLVCEKISSIESFPDYESLMVWSRFSGEYLETSDPWRKIALKSCEHLSKFDEDEKERILISFKRRKMETWFSTYGQMNPRWENFVKDSEEKLQSEKDPNLIKYFKLIKKMAISDLKQEKQHHEENHGE